MINNQNVPKLRFKEFSGEWEEKKLGEVAEIIMGQSPESNSYNLDKIGQPLIQGNADIQNRLSNPRNWTTQTTKECKVGDLILTVRAPVGAVAKSVHNACIGRGVCAIRNNSTSNIEFLFQFLLNFESKWGNLEQGSTFTAVSGNEIKKLKINIPSLPEQEKIVSFLTSVDIKIEQLTRKKTLLEKYKKGVMQKIFSQELRFKADDGSDYPEWVEKKLGEVAECLDNLRKPLNDEERQKIKGNIPYWGANNIMDYVNDYLFDETIVLLAEDGGNFNEYKTRPIANLSHGKCWVNNHTHVLRGKNDILIHEYLFYSLVHKNITGFVSGGTRAKLTKGEMLKITIFMPTLKEQTKIANFLSSLDEKCLHVSQQLDSTKQFKKALLQQMFV